MDWIEFDPSKWATQQHPVERRYVLVQIPGDVGRAPAVVVGYLKYGGGQKDSPFFVMPGADIVDSERTFIVSPTHWCDCLGDDFAPPLWKGKQTPHPDPIIFGLDDISVEDLDGDLFCVCDERPKTHKVMFDIRTNGTSVGVFEGCQVCCERFAAQMRTGFRDFSTGREAE